MKRKLTSSKVLIFGESPNDTQSIKHLLEHLNPALIGRVAVRRRPVSLTRTAGVLAVRSWVDAIADAVSAERRLGTRVAAVLVHRDADGADPAQRVHANLASELARIPAEPVVPVQMIESWWFHFPDAVEAVRPIAWHGVMPRGARDVDSISGPKTELMRLTRRTYEYSEADSVAIAEKIKALSARRLGRSASFDRLISTAGAIA